MDPPDSETSSRRDTTQAVIDDSQHDYHDVSGSSKFNRPFSGADIPKKSRGGVCWMYPRGWSHVAAVL